MPKNADKITAALEYLSSHPNLSLRTVSSIFGVHHSTLSNRRKGGQSRREARSEQQKLTIRQEELLVEWCKDLEKAGQSPTHLKLRDMALLVAGASNGPASIGKKWVLRFLQRHPSVRTKGSKKIEISRLSNAQPDVIRAWHQRLASIIKDFDIKPQDILNMDEVGIITGLQTNQLVIGSIDSAKGMKTTRDERESVTVIECVTAEGLSLKPFCIFKGKHVQLQWFDSKTIPDIPDWIYTCTPSAYTSNDVAIEWLDRVLVPYARNVGRKLLLIADGHGSHTTTEFMLKCHQSNIFLYYLPAHTSHFLQPLDISCFSPVKGFYRKQLDQVAVIDDSAKIKKQLFIQTYHHARSVRLNSDNIKSGFKQAGIHPLCLQKPLSSPFIRPSPWNILPTPPKVKNNSQNEVFTTPKRSTDIYKRVRQLTIESTLSMPLRRLLFQSGKLIDQSSFEIATLQAQLRAQSRRLEELGKGKGRKEAVDPNKVFIDIQDIERARERVDKLSSQWQASSAAQEALSQAKTMHKVRLEAMMHEFHVLDS